MRWERIVSKSGEFQHSNEIKIECSPAIKVYIQHSSDLNVIWCPYCGKEIEEIGVNIDILNTSWKVEVTPEQSAEIQRLLFKNGKTWSDGIKKVLNKDVKFLFYYCYNNYIKYSALENRDFFERNVNIELNADDIITALRKLEEGEKTISNKQRCFLCLDYYIPNSLVVICEKCIKKRDRAENDWRTLEEEMPTLNQEVEVKFNNEEIRKLRFVINNKTFFIFQNTGRTFTGYPDNIVGWRPLPPERKPDFGKLKKGDFIVIESENEKSGVFYSHQDDLTISFISISYNVSLSSFENEIFKKFEWCCAKSYIKKITRINMQTKEFEEI